MKARSADLSTLWEGVKYKHEREGRPVPRTRMILYHVVAAIFRWWAR